MAAKNSITQSRLKELLHYDPATGMFTWLVSRSTAVAGSAAGCLRDDGYWLIGIDGKSYLAHRLAFLYMTGTWPPDKTDHRNLIRDDNRWDNLRPATHGQNSLNSKPRGVSRYKGVCWNKGAGKWHAQAWFDGKKQHLSYHETEESAAAAYATFANEHFPEFMRLI